MLGFGLTFCLLRVQSILARAKGVVEYLTSQTLQCPEPEEQQVRKGLDGVVGNVKSRLSGLRGYPKEEPPRRRAILKRRPFPV